MKIEDIKVGEWYTPHHPGIAAPVRVLAVSAEHQAVWAVSEDAAAPATWHQYDFRLWEPYVRPFRVGDVVALSGTNHPRRVVAVEEGEMWVATFSNSRLAIRVRASDLTLVAEVQEVLA